MNNPRVTSEKPHQPKRGRGRPNDGVWLRRALELMHKYRDIDQLERCEVAQLPIVQKRARAEHPRAIMQVGQYCRALVLACLRLTANEEGETKEKRNLRLFAAALAKDKTLADASRSIGVSPAHGCRYYRLLIGVRLAQLIARQLQSKGE